MSDPSLLFAFLAAATILTITPGVDTAMVLRSATVEGRRSAVLASFGIGLGCLVWGAAVSFGLGALLHASELAYTVVKLAGAAYLLWLGVQLLLKPRTAMGDASGQPAARNGRDAFWRGLLTNLLNPKIGVFYITLPAAVRAKGRRGRGLFLFSGVPARPADVRVVRGADRRHGAARPLAAPSQSRHHHGPADGRRLRRLRTEARGVPDALSDRDVPPAIRSARLRRRPLPPAATAPTSCRPSTARSAPR